MGDQPVTTWLRWTGQAWKLAAFLLGELVFGVPLVLAVWQGRIEVIAVALPLLLAVIAWFFATVRCPACHERVVWRVVTTSPAGRWLVDLVALARCPRCGG